MTSTKRQVRVRSITYQGEFINAYEVVDPDGAALPPFTAGAHIDLHFRDGRIRQYSLCNDPAERHRYVFAVQREEAGRGGSAAIFEKIHVGRILTISDPRNNFSLAKDAEHHLLLAGGIGVTPMMAMVRHLETIGAPYTLHYCTRTPQRTAFRDELADLIAAGKVVLHHDQGDPRRGLDVAGLLAEPKPGWHVYYCGPEGFMNAIRAATGAWPKANVHFEYFSTPATSPADAAHGPAVGAFQIKIASTGAVYDVPDDKSIVEVLRVHGIEVETSCESGLCGTCKTRYIEGAPEHHDFILDDDEKGEYVMICSARSLTPLLLLDL